MKNLRLSRKFHHLFAEDMQVVIRQLDGLLSDGQLDSSSRIKLRKVRSDVIEASQRVQNELYFSPSVNLFSEILTEAEVRILKMLVEGLTTREIASKSNISEATVKTHLSSIYRKLEVRNRAEAIRKTLIDGLT